VGALPSQRDPEPGARSGADCAASSRSRLDVVTTVPPSRFVWEKTVRNARLGVSSTAVALVLATYANADGSSVRPGVSRVATGLGVSTRTVDRAMARLREEGYLLKVREGNSRAGKADEYRLSLPLDLTTASGETAAADGDHTTAEPDHPTDSDGHPTARLGHPSTMTRSPDADGAPPTHRPSHFHQPISTRSRPTQQNATAKKLIVDDSTRAARQPEEKGDFVARPHRALLRPSQLEPEGDEVARSTKPSPLLVPSQLEPVTA
jgi:hypothetical protein